VVVVIGWSFRVKTTVIRRVGGRASFHFDPAAQFIGGD
jgi:hypothetical protein